MKYIFKLQRFSEWEDEIYFGWCVFIREWWHKYLQEQLIGRSWVFQTEIFKGICWAAVCEEIERELGVIVASILDQSGYLLSIFTSPIGPGFCLAAEGMNPWEWWLGVADAGRHPCDKLWLLACWVACHVNSTRSLLSSSRKPRGPLFLIQEQNWWW